ncbi:MAG: shikimate kinase [Balneola sp.]|jgi:shikimate kinase|nr:shikimate kinase [Balneola sp.]MBE79896.1 shikimate kinase [Balneola sp.]HBX65675.1 shikimate kinase [Balneolaceae bacterium]|tara:strand:- start:58 stop:621 length:564 start_codon:yes stop_codon:yes gene_type:complete
MNSYRLERFKDSIYVCGFMASGKSTVGKSLADKLGREYRDLDAVIEEKEEQSIKEIFEEKGEEYFREKEWEYLLDLTRHFKGVVSLGGGALQNQRIIDHLKVSGILLYLETPMEVIVDRVLESDERPILFNESGKIKSRETLFTELKTLYSGRKTFYKQAQITIDTTLYSSVDEITEAAIEKITRHV